MVHAYPVSGKIIVFNGDVWDRRINLMQTYHFHCFLLINGSKLPVRINSVSHMSLCCGNHCTFVQIRIKSYRTIHISVFRTYVSKYGWWIYWMLSTSLSVYKFWRWYVTSKLINFYEIFGSHNVLKLTLYRRSTDWFSERPSPYRSVNTISVIKPISLCCVERNSLFIRRKMQNT